jgi:predicted HAD superfamily phosphohydrolase YqeG
MLKIAHCCKNQLLTDVSPSPNLLHSSSVIVSPIVDSILLTKWWVRTVHLLFTMILERFFRTIDAN